MTDHELRSIPAVKSHSYGIRERAADEFRLRKGEIGILRRQSLGFRLFKAMLKDFNLIQDKFGRHFGGFAERDGKGLGQIQLKFEFIDQFIVFK